MARGNYCGIKIPHTIVLQSQTSSTLSRGQVRCRMPSASHLVCASATAKWFNLLWLLLIGFAVLIAAVAAAQHLRGLSSAQVFIEQHHGVGEVSPGETSALPRWLGAQQFLNLFLMVFIIRSGIQILTDRPRLYWTRHGTPGREWFHI